MPFIPTPNMVRVSVEYVISGLPAANVLHMQHALGALDQAEVDAMALEVATAWQAEVMPLITNNVTLAQVIVTDVSSQTGPQGEAVAGGVGGSASAPLPPNIATCVSIRTALRSRSGRGRSYIPGVGEDKVDGAGTITQAYRDALIVAFEDVDAALAAGASGLLMGVLSLYSGVDEEGNPIPRAAGLFSRATTYTCDATIDTQRRRLR